MAGSSRKLTVNELLGAYSSTATKDSIKKIQQALKEQGYNMSKSTKKNGQYDGIVGKETRAALDAYMKDAGYAPQPNKTMAESQMQKTMYNTFLTQGTKVADKRKAPTPEEFYAQAEQVRKTAEARLKTKYGPNVKVDIVQKERTLEQQKALLAKGASQTSFSSHNLGLGADAQITINGVVQSGTTKATIAPYDILGGAAKDAGMFWGWGNDPGHFQYNPYPKGTVKNKNYYGYVDEILREHPELADQEITKAFYQTKKTAASKRLEPVLSVLDSLYNTPTARVYIGEARTQNTLRTPAYAYGGKLPIDMYGRSVRKYEGGGWSTTNRAPNPASLTSLPAGVIQDYEYQKYLAKINSEGIEKVAQSPGLLSTKTTNTTRDAIGTIGNIASGFLSSAGTKQVDKGRIVGGTAMQAAGAVAPIATNPALLTATGGLSALAIPLAAGIGALAGIPKQKKYNRIEDANNIDEGMAMYQGLNQQNNYMQDPIRYAAYGGKINHYDNGTPGITYGQEGGHISPVEIVGQKIHKAVSANIFADLIEAMNAPKKGKTKSIKQTLRDVLYGYSNPTFVEQSKGYEPTFYGGNNYTMTNRWAPQHAAYGGQFPGGELAQVESGETFSHGGTLHSVKTKSKHKDLPENLANQFLPNNSTVYSSIPIKNIKDILPIAKQFGLNTDLTAVKLYAGEVKNGTTVADLSKKGYKKLQPKKDLGNQFYTKADLRNTKYFEEGLAALGEVLNPETYRNIANNEYAQGQQGIQQILHAAYGGKVNHYGDPEDEPGYRSGNSSWAGAPGAGLRDAQYPPEMLNPPIVNVPTTITGTPTVPPPTYTPLPSDGPYNSRMTPKAFTTYIEPRGLYDNAPIDIAPPDPWQNPPYAYPTTTTPEQEFEKHKQETGGGNYPGFSGYTPPESLNGSTTTGNKKSPYKLSPADIAALGVGGANAAASLLTLQQKMYDNEVTDKSRLYNMKTELPDNFTNPTLGALRAGLQSNAQNNNWKNTSAMNSEMLSKTVAGLNSALLEQSRQNVGLFNAKQAAIYQALGIDTANKLAWNKDDTALHNYKLSAIGENLLKMASNGNTRAAENALAQMDDATLRAMLTIIGPNSKYFTEQIERIINSRKG